MTDVNMVGVLITPSQNNITSLGTLSSLSVSGTTTLSSTVNLTNPAIFDIGTSNVYGTNQITYFSKSVAYSTVQEKFGNTSILYSSSSAFLLAQGITTTGFSGGIFTFECFFYPTATTADQTIFSLVTSTNLFYVFVRMNTSRNIVADFGNAGTSYNGGTSVASTNTCTLNTWNHVVFQYDGAAYFIYINGTRGVNYNQTGLPIPNSAFAQVYIGCYGYPNPVNPVLNGYIDEVRLSTNARYTGTSITVPTSPFVSDANTVYLNHFEGTNNLTDFTYGQETPTVALTDASLYSATGNIDCNFLTSRNISIGGLNLPNALERYRVSITADQATFNTNYIIKWTGTPVGAISGLNYDSTTGYFTLLDTGLYIINVKVKFNNSTASGLKIIWLENSIDNGTLVTSSNFGTTTRYNELRYSSNNITDLVQSYTLVVNPSDLPANFVVVFFQSVNSGAVIQGTTSSSINPSTLYISRWG